MIPENYKYAVGFQCGSPERFQRISEVLAEAAKSGHKLTVADMENLQNDVTSLPARELQALLKQAAWNAPDAAAKLILDWDCAVTADSAAAALYEFWVEELRIAITKLVVPAEARDAAPLFLPKMVRELAHARGIDRNALLLETLNSAAQKAAARLGPDPQSWAWGKLHEMHFSHSLDVNPDLAKLFDRGPLERPGDNYTVNATGFGGASFHQVAGASYREIFDLNDWDRAVGVNVPGQSGQPGSPHYDDLLPLWGAGQYFPLSFSKAAVDRETTDILELKP